MALNARSGTLTPSTVATVAITDAWPDGIWVTNRTQSGQIWVRFDGVNPVVGADDCYVVLGARLFPVTTSGRDAISVKLISTQALDYTVEGSVLGL